MPSPGQMTSSMALWLHLRRRAASGQGPVGPVSAPPGDGPLVLVHLSENADDPLPVGGLVKAMVSRRPRLRFVFTGATPTEGQIPPDLRETRLVLPDDPAAVSAALDVLSPGGLVLLGDRMPSSLIAGMADRRLPIVLAEARLLNQGGRGSWRGIVNRGLIRCISNILVPDVTTGAAARQLGADPDRIEIVGPVTETLPPLHANEAERAALAQILRGRHVWLAAAPTMPEIRILLQAHQAALQHNHRALLILAGLPEELVPRIRAETESQGLAAVLRSEDEDPMADDHVLIADDPYEMGLWYRLSPVCFMGGTLLPGPGLAPRHPFEPAALGSAIIHGPISAPFAAEWLQLTGASAARSVTDAETLSRAVADLTAPDQAAMLAGNAWSVSTGGAAVIRRIADAVIDAMESSQ
ncbi:3-deoxy-D-manno-octulosonic acid transferase [Paracoccus aestuariivivens]|uniref:3-deoxy-D-manno-octulosonic acid transferase n=1 Tax=Paracoccus aestuariivivens TaxID=1820333 RepID=A0A6L6JA27_9RHOB|nr:glycosyltransferase N-terminal domain-containing protein [Paracoccus aestuariivivens]MTH78932.1 3-deoxy-D-manno-octulosonic acid transferase [Paracoccus aestuariivivens]